MSADMLSNVTALLTQASNDIILNNQTFNYPGIDSEEQLIQLNEKFLSGQHYFGFGPGVQFEDAASTTSDLTSLSDMTNNAGIGKNSQVLFGGSIDKEGDILDEQKEEKDIGKGSTNENKLREDEILPEFLEGMFDQMYNQDLILGQFASSYDW